VAHVYSAYDAAVIRSRAREFATSVVPDAFNREPRVVFSLTKVCFVGELLDAGFRPCRRGPFDCTQDRPLVSTKGPKTCVPSMFNSLRCKSFEGGSSLDLLSDPLSLVWQGARTAHTSLYGKDEQCRQTGWIDAQTREVILARTLRDESTDLSSRGLGQRPWAHLW